MLICAYPASEGRKQLLTGAYDYQVNYKGLSWIKPKFVREDKPIFLTLEVELHPLVANTQTIYAYSFIRNASFVAPPH